MSTALQHQRARHTVRRETPLPAGKHGHYAPLLIGYALLGLALLLVAVGVATA